MNEEQIRADFTRLVERRAFKPMVRLLRADIAEERAAEGTAMTWEQYRAKRMRGEVMDDALVVHAARVRACDLSRQLVRGGQRLRDVLDERAFHLGRVEVLRVDGFSNSEQDRGAVEEDCALQVEALALATPAPEQELLSALDLERWLSSLTPRERLLLALRAAGHTLHEIAAKVGSSLSVVFKQIRALGLALAEIAEVTVQQRSRKAVCP